ncbi:MAG: T9SS type A sorting domain-containing protein [Flavobacteriales bacterium]
MNYPDSAVALPTSAQADTSATDLEGPTVIPPASPEIRWSYYPNPTTGIVHLTSDVAIPELYITDLSGKVLQVLKGLKADEAVQIDLGSYATGIYLIRYPFGTGWLSGQVVLQRS